MQSHIFAQSNVRQNELIRCGDGRTLLCFSVHLRCEKNKALRRTYRERKKEKKKATNRF